ncbi:MAG: cation:proton antiporter [Bacteroidales bacterium]|nr:cation:proton antiporter [Bacteroidales bacterium]
MTGSLGLSVALFLFGLIVFICVLLNDASSRRGVPMLLAFILFGMVCGNVRSIPIYLDDSGLAERICTVALVFIMFYGGFGTSWKSAKKVAVESGLLATAGVVITALVTGLFCRFVLKWEWAESLLLGAVLSSTDAASVFSILRSNKLGLKNNTAPILEVESGSNDPAAYMLTAVMISIVNGGASGGGVSLMVLAQIGLGTVFGLLIAQGGIAIMRKLSFREATCSTAMPSENCL